ncbi:MAG: hypothetical protein ABH832_02010 [bacterium]
MFDLQKNIKILFPKNTDFENKNILEVVKKNISAYNQKSWQQVKREDLAKDRTKLLLLGALIEVVNGGEQGLIDIILNKLEMWTLNTIFFKELDEKSQIFYSRFYALSAYLNFQNLGNTRQNVILKGQFLPMILTFRLNFFNEIKKYFLDLRFIDLLKEESKKMAESIKQNHSIIIGEKEGYMVSWWIEKFNKFCSGYTSDQAGIIDNFLNENNAFKDLNIVNKYVIKQILFIYMQLKSNLIWKSLDTSVQSSEQWEKGVEKKYLEELKKGNDIKAWLKTWKEIIAWFETRDEQFVKSLLLVVKEKVDLNDHEQMELLLNLIENLPKKHKVRFNDALFFNESDQKFHWNEEIFK